MGSTSRRDAGGSQCKFCFYPDDVRRLTDDKTTTTFNNLRSVDYEKRLRQTAKEDPEIWTFLQRNARACPKCRVMIIRSEGCDSMLCTCGERFNWASCARLRRHPTSAASPSSRSLGSRRA